MAKQTVAPVAPALPVLREVGIQGRVIAVKKSELRKGWESASRPGVLDTLRAADERDIEETAALLISRYS